MFGRKTGVTILILFNARQPSVNVAVAYDPQHWFHSERKSDANCVFGVLIGNLLPAGRRKVPTYTAGLTTRTSKRPM